MVPKDVKNVCHPCGITANYLTCLKKYGRPPLKAAFDISTYHQGTCDVCGRFTNVTEARDFFHPDFELIFQAMKYDHEPTGNFEHQDCAICISKNKKS